MQGSTRTVAIAPAVTVTAPLTMKTTLAHEHEGRQEVKLIRDIVPMLPIDIILQLLDTHDWDVERATDAALTYSVELAAETETGTEGGYTYGNGDDDNLQSRSSFKKFLHSQEHLNASRGERGTPLLLNDSFLSPPRFRLSVDTFNNVYVDFTVLFNRTHEKLGIVIETNTKEESPDSEICIRDMTHNSSLAKSAGLQIGDIITGVEKNYFSPGADIGKVLDVLKNTGSFVSLHFRRYKVGRHSIVQSRASKYAGDEAAAVEPSSYHKFAQLLLEQSVISEQRAQKVTESVALLKARVLQWDSGTLAERVQKLQDRNSAADGQASSLSPRARLTMSGRLLSGGSRESGGGLSDRFRSSPRKRTSVEQGMHATIVLPSGEDNCLEELTTLQVPKDGSGEKHEALLTQEREQLESENKARGARRDVSNSNRNLFRDSKLDLYSTSIVIPTKDLRPALFTRVLRAEGLETHVVYVMWVMDIKSGAQWIVRRRFREFFEFRETLVGIRKSIGALDFPPKAMVTNNPQLIAERTRGLQKFMRKTSSLLCVNSLHPSTASVQNALQKFLDVSIKMPAITIMEKESENFGINSNLQTYVHSVMQMSVMDRIYDSFIDHFLGGTGGGTGVVSEEVGGGYSHDNSLKILETVQLYMDNLQGVMCEGLSEDGFAIVSHCQKLIQDKWRDTMGADTPPRSVPGTPTNINLPKSNECTVSTSVEDDVNSLSPADLNIKLPSSAPAPEPASPKVDDRSQSHSTERKEVHSLVKNTSNLSSDEVHDLVRTAVRRQVELEVYVACSERLWQVLESGFEEEDALIDRNIEILYSNPQSFYGISVTTISPTSWEKVVMMVSNIRHHYLPRDRLNYLISCAKEIPDVYATEHPSNPDHLGADEFLPIFIYVLVQARIPNLLALNAEMQALVDPEKRVGESGYYLATLEAAIEHIRDLSSFSTTSDGRPRGISELTGDEQIKAIENAGISFHLDSDSDSDEGSDETDEDTDVDEETQTRRKSMPT